MAIIEVILLAMVWAGVLFSGHELVRRMIACTPANEAPIEPLIILVVVVTALFVASYHIVLIITKEGWLC